VELRPCVRCGGTLTGAFRFCPGCGLPSDDPGLALERRRPRRAARRARWRAVGGSAGRLLGSVAGVAGGLRGRVSGWARSLRRRRLRVRVRGLGGGVGEAARLVVEVVVLSARSARDSVRSFVLVRRLYGRRAAVIYSTGCAVLGGEDRRFEEARAELRLLDELITAASGRTSFASALGRPAAAAPADVPTEESVLLPPAPNRVPALRRGD
jgi:hypothetical protein